MARGDEGPGRRVRRAGAGEEPGQGVPTSGGEAGSTARTATKAAPKTAPKTATKAASRTAPKTAPKAAPETAKAGPGGAPPASGTPSAPAARGVLPVRPEEDPWTTSELAEVQADLEAEVARLRVEVAEAEGGLAELLRDSGEGAGDDQADSGSKAFEREHGLSLANNSRGLLQQGERALARIEHGSYGICEACGSPIGKLRLQAFPRATLCVTCKQQEERR